jgi:hypothetical protein
MTTIAALPSAPLVTDLPAAFNTKALALVGALGTFVTQTNAAAAEMVANVAAVAQGFVGTSTTSWAIAAGSKVFTVTGSATYALGSWVKISSAANPNNYGYGTVSAFASPSLTVDVQDIGGSGTYTDWNINMAGARGATNATATSLAGGAAGRIAYQFSLNVTAFSAAGTAGQLFVSGGTGAPTWTSAPALGTPASGDFSSGTFTWPTFNQNTSGSAGNLSGTPTLPAGTVLDNCVIGGTNKVGFRGLPPASVTTGAFVAADAGKCVYATAGVTVPNATMAAYDAVVILNTTGSAITITQAAGLTLRKAGTATTGNMSLAAYGIGTVVFTGASAAIMSGNI